MSFHQLVRFRVHQQAVFKAILPLFGELAAQGRRRQLREGHRFSLRGEGSVHGLVRVLTGLGGEGEGWEEGEG